MTREIKFRAWNTDYKEPKMEHFNLMDAMFSGDSYRLHDKSIMQFTELYDITGAEIYEDDVVKFTLGHLIESYEHIGTVSFDSEDGVASYVIEYEGGNIIDIFTRVEIIGNIHENPELLEE